MTESAPSTSMGGCIVRVLWCMVLPALILVVGFSLFLGGSSFGAIDVVYAGLIAVALIARLIDRLPADGADVSTISFKRYAAFLLSAAVVLYGLARLVLPRILGGGGH